MAEGRAGKTTDAMLDKIGELVAERNEALARLARVRTVLDGTVWTDESWRANVETLRAMTSPPAALCWADKGPETPMGAQRFCTLPPHESGDHSWEAVPGPVAKGFVAGSQTEGADRA